MNTLYSKGLRSSISPGVIIKLRISPFSSQIKCNLKPKSQPIEHFPLWAMPLKTLCICILWFLQTRSGVLSTKLTPVHLPNKTFLINEVRGKLHPFPILLYGYKKQLLETDGEAACILFQDRNVEATITRIVEKNHYQHNFCL